MSATLLASLLLADGRFPAGGHAHSAGMESAVLDRRVTDEATLEAYLLGRLHTTALVDASLAAATIARRGEHLAALDAEADARITVPSLRVASKRLGRQLVRAADRCWPCALLARVPPEGLHQAVALGVVGITAGLDERGGAALAIHHALSTPAQAAVRLLGLDPFAVASLLAQFADEAAGVIEAAVASSSSPLVDLPAFVGLSCEIAAANHPDLDGRLFVT